MDPVELAKIFKQGIENDQLYVIPYPDSEQMLKDNFQRVLYSASPEGVKKLEALRKKRMEEMKKQQGGNDPYEHSADVGFGKARADLTWVKNAAKQPPSSRK